MPRSLLQRIRDQTRQALAGGALQPLTTRIERVADGGVDYVVHVLQSRPAKPAPGGDADPFLDPEPALLVAEISSSHRVLLNKFNVLDEHALIVTRAFEDQVAPLTLADFEAVRWCLEQFEGLAFYNAGAVAGASQRHRHLQIVPLPLAAGIARMPLEPRDGRDLPFRHATARFGRALPPVAAWLASYGALRAALGVGSDGYNLLATREWMMLVPRPREQVEGLGVNALGFAGVLLVKDEAQLADLRRIGPAKLLHRLTQ